MRRYIREENDIIYDRLARRFIEVRTEKQIGDAYYVNSNSEDEIVIHRDEIEERR
jgi:hypothetical protein